VVIPLPKQKYHDDRTIRRLTCVCTKCDARVSETERVWAGISSQLKIQSFPLISMEKQRRRSKSWRNGD